MNEHDRLRIQILRILERDWGMRCEMKDTDEFPDLKNNDSGRCPVCLVYDRFDEFWQMFCPEEFIS